MEYLKNLLPWYLQEHTENDEVDGSVRSRFRRRGVKVTGRYIPPLEWEKVNLSHSVSSLNNSYFEKVYDDMEKIFQASNMSTKLLLKDDKQGSTQADYRGGNTRKTEQEKQRMESVTSDSKNAENMPQEKITDRKTDDKSTTEKCNEDVLPYGSAIPKETLEELKIVLKESPLIHNKHNCNPKINTTITEISIPKHVESTREKPSLTFKTFRPYLEKESQKQQSEQSAEFFDAKHSHEVPIDPILPDPVQSQKDEEFKQPIQACSGDQISIPDHLNIASGTKFEPPTAEFKGKTILKYSF